MRLIHTVTDALALATIAVVGFMLWVATPAWAAPAGADAPQLAAELPALSVAAAVAIVAGFLLLSHAFRRRG
jgi:hypothetical protein